MSFGVMYGAIYKLQYIKILDKKKKWPKSNTYNRFTLSIM